MKDPKVKVNCNSYISEGLKMTLQFSLYPYCQNVTKDSVQHNLNVERDVVLSNVARDGEL